MFATAKLTMVSVDVIILVVLRADLHTYCNHYSKISQICLHYFVNNNSNNINPNVNSTVCV